jgi:hypothetical protein
VRCAQHEQRCSGEIERLYACIYQKYALMYHIVLPGIPAYDALVETIMAAVVHLIDYIDSTARRSVCTMRSLSSDTAGATRPTMATKPRAGQLTPAMAQVPLSHG